MAYVFDQLDDEEEQRKLDEEGAGASGTPTTVLGSSSGGPQNTQPVGSGSGSGFTNLRTYLNANREQAGELSGKIAANLGEKSAKARSDIDALGQKFDEDVKSASFGDDEDLLNRAASDPMAFSKNQADMDAFTKRRLGEYGGPKRFDEGEGYSKALADVGGLENFAKQTDTEGGRSELVKSLNPNMGAGKVALNQALVGADPNARQTLGAAVQPFNELRSYLQGKVAPGAEAVSGAQANAKKASDALAQRFTGEGGVIPTFQSGLDQRVQDAIGNANTALSRQRSGVTNGGRALKPEDYQNLGLQGQEQLTQLDSYNNALARYHGVMLNNGDFFSETDPTLGINRGNVSSADDYARSSALASLMGLDDAGLSQDQAGQAGTSPTDFADFDFTGAMDRSKQRLLSEDQTYLAQDPSTLNQIGQSRYMEIAKRGAGNLPTGEDSYTPPTIPPWSVVGDTGRVTTPIITPWGTGPGGPKPPTSNPSVPPPDNSEVPGDMENQPQIQMPGETEKKPLTKEDIEAMPPMQNPLGGYLMKPWWLVGR